MKRIDNVKIYFFKIEREGDLMALSDQELQDMAEVLKRAFKRASVSYKEVEEQLYSRLTPEGMKAATAMATAAQALLLAEREIRERAQLDPLGKKRSKLSPGGK